MVVENLLNFLGISDEEISADRKELLKTLNVDKLNKYINLNLNSSFDAIEDGNGGIQDNQRGIDDPKSTFSELIRKYYLLKWRNDQRSCIDKFLQFLLPTNTKKVMFIQAVFGSGKTTLAKAFVFLLLFNNHFYEDNNNRLINHNIETENILISAYNISVKEELEEEMAKYLKNVKGKHKHISANTNVQSLYDNNKFNVQTYDSIIHEVNGGLNSRYCNLEARFHAEKRLYAYKNIKRLKDSKKTNRD